MNRLTGNEDCFDNLCAYFDARTKDAQALVTWEELVSAYYKTGVSTVIYAKEYAVITIAGLQGYYPAVIGLEWSEDTGESVPVIYSLLTDVWSPFPDPCIAYAQFEHKTAYPINTSRIFTF